MHLLRSRVFGELEFVQTPSDAHRGPPVRLSCGWLREAIRAPRPGSLILSLGFLHRSLTGSQVSRHMNVHRKIKEEPAS